MNNQLRVGDVFLLPDGPLVMIDRPGDKEHDQYVAEIGRVYDVPMIDFDVRYELQRGIENVFFKKKLKPDKQLIRRFVNHVAPDRPASTFCIPSGRFLVIRIERTGTNEEDVFCQRFEPEPGQDCDCIHFDQNRHGHGHYPYQIVGSVRVDK